MDCLGLWSKTQQQHNNSGSMGAVWCNGSWSKSKHGHYCGSVLHMYESSLLCRDSCLMPRMKFGSNTMLKYISNAMCYIILYARVDAEGEA